MDLVAAARAAGAAGQRWHDWVMSDEAQDAIAAKEHWSEEDQTAVERAFEEGAREVAAARGRIIWTTAPKDYDTADAVELEVLGDYFGRPLRKVAVDPEGYEYQTGRYASGTYGVWDKNPIAEDQRVRDEYAAREAERAAHEAKHQAGIAWLRTASAEELANEDLVWEHGATHKEVREEKARRREQEEGEKTAAEWSRVASLLPEGVTLIDEGEYIPAPMVGLQAVHRPSRIYFNTHVIHGYPDDVLHARVEHGSGRPPLSTPLVTILDLLEKGKLRIALEGEVPPPKVVERIGVEKWKDIRRVEVGGHTVWVGRATFGSEDLVLDAEGKLVRGKKIAEAAIAAAHAHDGHARGPHRRGSALGRRYGRSFRSRGRVRVLGMSHDVTHCEQCGKTGLDSTVMLSVDGSPPVYVGSECAQGLLRTG